MPDDREERLTERLMVQLSASDLRALSAIAEEMERPLSWVARRGIRLYIAQVLSAEETLLRSDEVIERVREAHQRGEET
jgi:predicted transcriptional regulator